VPDQGHRPRARREGARVRGLRGEPPPLLHSNRRTALPPYRPTAHRAPFLPVFEIGTGVASLVGVVVPDLAEVADKRIRDISIPAECVVAAVVRGKQFVVPRGDTVIQTGDHVVFVGPTGAVKKAHDTFLQPRRGE